MQNTPVTTFSWGGISLALILFFSIGLVMRALLPRIWSTRSKSSAPSEAVGTSPRAGWMMWIAPILVMLVAIVPFFGFRSAVVVPESPPATRPMVSLQFSETDRMIAQAQTAGRIDVDGPAATPGSEPATESEAAIASQRQSEDSMAKPLFPATSDDLQGRRKRLADFAGQIGQLVRSQLESPRAESPVASSTGESSNGDVVVFQLSEEMLRQMLGDSATEMLQTFNAQLPGGIRQTYALIPLSSPVGATVPQVQPLLAASGLSSLADSLVSLLTDTTTTTSITTPDAAPSTDPGTTAATTSPPTVEPLPEWITAPQPGQRIAETPAQFPGADQAAALNTAVSNTALQIVLEKHAKKLPEVRAGTWKSALQLSPALAEQCIARRYVRTESLETGVEGKKDFRVHYALVEVPPEVEQKIFAAVAADLRRIRAVVLTVVVAGLWLAVVITAAGLRCANSGIRLQRRLAWPLLTLSLPLGLLLLLSLAAVLSGTVPRADSRLVDWSTTSARLVVTE